MRRACILFAAVVLTSTSVAHAQPSSIPPGPPAPVTDSAEVIDLFHRGIDTLSRGQLADAAAIFRQVAQRSVEPRRRAAAEELATYLDDRVAGRKSHSKMPEDELADSESGRSAFLASTVVLGLNYGWIVPYVLNVDDTKAFVGLYMVTAGASFTVPYLVTRDQHITRAMSIMGSAGAYLGFGHGALLYGTLAGENGFETDSDARLMLATMLGSSILEGSLGYVWARNSRMSAGEAMAISAGSVWGVGYAFAGNVLAHQSDANARLIMGTTLAGSLAGGLAGKLYSDNRRLTEGDANMVSYTGLIGAYASLAPLIVGEVDDERVVAGTLMVGAAAGLFAGDLLTRHKDYTRGQAGLVGLGSLAGGLLGAGGGFLLTPNDTDTEKLIVPASAAGAIAGLIIMVKAVDANPEPSAAGGLTVSLAPVVGPNGETGLGLAGSF